MFPNKFSLVGQDLFDFLRREKVADHGNGKNDHGQHQEDLYGVVDEKINGVGNVGAFLHVENVVGEPVGECFDQFSFLLYL